MAIVTISSELGAGGVMTSERRQTSPRLRKSPATCPECER